MKAILVTGATGHLGTYVCERLSKEGFTVLAVGKSEDKLQTESINETHHSIAVNLTGKDSLNEILDLIPHQVSSVYGFIHLARDVSNLQGPETPRESWLKEFELATYVPYRIAKDLAKRFKLRRVILGSSIYGEVAQRPRMYTDSSLLHPHYNSAKAATNQLARDLAVQLAPTCQVNSISWGGMSKDKSNQVEISYSAENPSGKMITLQEAYEPIDFLLRPHSSGITGHNLLVDGGWTAW